MNETTFVVISHDDGFLRASWKSIDGLDAYGRKILASDQTYADMRELVQNVEARLIELQLPPARFVSYPGRN